VKGTRAVLFDLGGTLYDYATLEPGAREALVSLVRAAGGAAPPEKIFEEHRSALRQVFHAYLPRRYHLHRDLFRDVLLGLGKRLGLSLTPDLLDRHRELQRQNLERDFALREGVSETLAALRGRGFYLAIVSNIDEEQLEHLAELGRLRERFDDLLSSEAARSCKPDRGIFEKALRRAECTAAEALYVGDTVRQDIEGANRIGIPSVLLWHRDDRPAPRGEPRPRHVIRRIGDLLELLEP
jgi:putative hydrolase of the HAD superfamily